MNLIWVLFSRSLLSWVFLPVLALTVIVMGGCTTDIITPELEDTAGSKTEYDGEVLFRALFFGQGDLSTALFPEVWRNENIEAKRGPHDPEVIAFREDVVEWVASNHSAFFAKFGRELQSGDHVRVDATLNAAGGMLEKAIYAVGDEEVLAATKEGHISPMDQTCIFVYRTLAVAIHYAAVVWRVRVAAVPAKIKETGALQREQFVDIVARRLAWTG